MKHLCVFAIVAALVAGCGKADKADDEPKPAKPPATTTETKPRFQLALSTATVALVKGFQNDSIKAQLFFPKGHEASLIVRDYVTRLAKSAGVKIAITEHSMTRQRKLARALGVRKDGTLVMSRGDVHRKIWLGLDTSKPRFEKRDALDRSVGQMLRDAKPRGTIYVVYGLDSRRPTTKPQQGVATFKRIVTAIGFKLAPLGSLKPKVPDDAAFVALLGIEKPVPAALSGALRSYVDRGGRLLIATYGGRASSAAGILDHMDLTYDPGLLLDPKHNANTKPANPALLMTSQLAKHPVWRHLKFRDRQMLFPVTGSFRRSSVRKQVKREFTHETIAHTESTAFRDKNANGKRDGAEKTGRYALAVAVTGPKGMRALVLGSAVMFTDGVAARLRHLQLFFDAAARWLDSR